MISLSKGNALPFPSKCLLCGNSQKDCINFPVTQPWNGAMLICIECFAGVVRNFQEELGYLPVGVHKKVAAELASERKKTARINEVVEILRSGVDQLAADVRDLLDVNSPVVSSSNGPSNNKVDEIDF